MIARSTVLTVLLLATMASAIALVWSIQQSRLAFVELTRLGAERDDLNFEFGRLQLEQATLAENNRVEQVARGKLGMLSPLATDSVVMKR